MATSILLLTPLIAGSFSVRAESPQYQQGEEAYSRGDLKRAAELWHPLATAGEADAQFALGTLYYVGAGVRLDQTESSYWFHRAAEQGHGAAQYNLGNAYQRGEGVKKNKKMAVHWWRKAADQGLAAAQLNLGMAYWDGFGVDKDRKEAVRLFRESAAANHEPAIEVLRRLESARADSGETGNCKDWIDRQGPENYTLQLMSTTRPQEAENIVRKATDKNRYFVCSYPHQGTTRYALLYGSYPDSNTARTAIDSLPDRFRVSKPWIRKLGSIRKLLAASD